MGETANGSGKPGEAESILGLLVKHHATSLNNVSLLHSRCITAEYTLFWMHQQPSSLPHNQHAHCTKRGRNAASCPVQGQCCKIRTEFHKTQRLKNAHPFVQILHCIEAAFYTILILQHPIALLRPALPHTKPSFFSLWVWRIHADRRREQSGRPTHHPGFASDHARVIAIRIFPAR